MAKEEKNVVQIPKWLLIPLVLIIFGGGGWSGVMQYQIGELNKAQAKTAKDVQDVVRNYYQQQQLINENLTKINANIITIATANGVKLPFDNSRGSLTNGVTR